MLVKEWPNKLTLASVPTPLHPLKRLSAELGKVNLWIKRDDLTGSLLSGNKIRKLEFSLAYLLEQGYDQLITCGGLQSNHCRATAYAGAQLGIPVHLVLRGEEQVMDGNLLLDYLAGATVSSYPKSEYQQALPQLLQQWSDHYTAKGKKPWVIPTGASDGLGVWGYLAAYEELLGDFAAAGIQPERIICATGSGGTQAGLTLGNYLARQQGLPAPPVTGMAVCDDAAYFARKVRQDVRAFLQMFTGLAGLGGDFSVDALAVDTNDNYIGEGYAKASDDVMATIAWLARTEGILLDPVYTGKAFHGLVDKVRMGHFKQGADIVFVHTGGSFGIFPYRDQLQNALNSEKP